MLKINTKIIYLYLMKYYQENYIYFVNFSKYIYITFLNLQNKVFLIMTYNMCDSINIIQ